MKEKISKQKKSLKRMIVCLLVLAMTSAMFQSCVSLASNKTTTKMYKQYIRKIEKNPQKYGFTDMPENNKCSYAITKVGRKPLLFLWQKATSDTFINKIYDVSKGKVHSLRSVGESASAGIYTYKNYILVGYGTYGNWMGAELYQYTKGKLVQKAKIKKEHNMNKYIGTEHYQSKKSEFVKEVCKECGLPVKKFKEIKYKM